MWLWTTIVPNGTGKSALDYGAARGAPPSWPACGRLPRVTGTSPGNPAPVPAPARGGARFAWLDVVKGISILWVVVFHTLHTRDTQYPWALDPGYFSAFMQQCAPGSWTQSIGCGLGSLVIAVIGLGFHAVDVFLVASGFGLVVALRPDAPPPSWGRWYGKRLLRLFPMYWVAHLVYLVSPLLARPEPLDYRFVLSFFGDRVYPIDSLFYYANASWWYFGLLVELYLVFPLLYTMLRKTSPAGFLLVTGLFTLLSRELLLNGLPVSGLYLVGGFFGTRLWEFALGMALATLAQSQPPRLEGWLFARRTLAAGMVLYGLALLSYRAGWAYVFTDPLVGTGLFIILAHVARAIGHWQRLAYVGVYSYGLYLLHQPYVIYFGAHAGALGTAAYLLLSIPVIATLTLGAIALERAVNALTKRLSGA